MVPISSSDSNFNLDNRTVYVICCINSDFGFQVAQKDLTHNCPSPCVPRTDKEFTTLAKNVKNYVFKSEDDSDESIRFWTDYIRINETHSRIDNAKKIQIFCPYLVKLSEIDNPMS